MKKYISILLIMFLMPVLANAETLTYNVCETCEYTDLSTVKDNIDSLSDLTDKDIIININSDYSNQYGFNITEGSNFPKSITINGNNHNLDAVGVAFKNIKDVNISGFGSLAYITTENAQNLEVANIDKIIHQLDLTDIQNISVSNIGETNTISIYNSQKIKLLNTHAFLLLLGYVDSDSYQLNSEEINLNDVLEVDESTLNSLKTISILGNIKIENMDFGSQVIVPYTGTINIYNSNVGKIVSYPATGDIFVNIYNSNFNSLKYTNIDSSEDDSLNDFQQFMMNNEPGVLNYDIYDVDSTSMGGQTKSNTMVYFDKETKLKPGDKLDLSSYLDYYTEDKEIEYTIEDESIAKIENKELIGLKEGSTKVTITTDEGHVVYRINLVVEKETIPEKIDKMTIKVPITGNRIKAWVLVVSTLLLGVIVGCIYMLIKSKKVTK